MCKHLSGLGKLLGEGSDGQVYQSLKYPNRVIKIGSANDVAFGKKHFDAYNYVKLYKPEPYAKLYKFRKIDCHDCDTEYIAEMEKLFPVKIRNKESKYSITYDERLTKAIQFVQRKWVRTGRKVDFSQRLFEKALGASYKIVSLCKAKEKRKIYEFMEKLYYSSVIHQDPHDGNIMQDADGNLKMIDFDRLYIRKNKT